MKTPRRGAVRPLLLALLAALAPALHVRSLQAQTARVSRTMSGVETTTIPDGGVLVRSGVGPRRFGQTYDPRALVDVIVQFETPPRALAGPSAGKQALETHYERERADLRAGLGAVAGKQANTPFRHDYRRLFNGVALRTEAAAAAHLATLPGVRRVYDDVRVQALGAPGGPAASHAAPASDATGEGVVVAIIDSGIDYGHPALGGGFGAGFKVVGGYDFVDRDADPMDENGHGTHVAGIVAADGVVTGVAPGARLLAVRVLDMEGAGETSVILAGIEWAVDPDGDPATDDGADVLNLSLGGDGDPDDPLAQAVDAAAAVGVLSVVAAGNGGDGGRYETVGSPAAARSALTVGAVDDADGIAYFTSRGPTRAPYLIKPDLVAPGVDIVSTLPGGGSGPMSGTSMATPYVAGVAARLLERRPGLPPAVVKSLLVQGTVDLGEDAWTQGAGRLDAAVAEARDVAVLPASLSLGLVDVSSGSWTTAEQIVLHNLAEEPRTFDLSVEGLAAAGLAATVTPARVTVPAGGTATATVEVVVDGAVLPFVPLLPPAYAGTVRAVTPGAVLRVPVSIVRTPVLTVTTDEPAEVLHAYNQTTGAAYIWPMNGATERSFMVEAGAYVAVALFTSLTPEGRTRYAISVAEDVVVEAPGAAHLRAGDARHRVAAAPVDEVGRPVGIDYASTLLVHAPSGYGFELGAHPGDVVFSTLSDRFRVELFLNSVSHAAGSDYAFLFTADGGLDADRTVGNAPGDLHRVTTSFEALPDAASLLLLPWWTEHAGGSTISTAPYDAALLAAHRVGAAAVHHTYLARLPAGPERSVFSSIGLYRENDYEFPDTDGGVRYESGHHTVAGGELRIFDERDFDRPVYRSTARAVDLAAGLPPAFGAALAHEDGARYLSFNGLLTRGAFVGPYGELVADTVRVTLTGGAAQTEATFFNRRIFAGFPYFDVAPSAYDMRVRYGATSVDGVATEATGRLRFDTAPGRADVYPPFMGHLTVRSDGVPGSVVRPGAEGAVVVALQDLTGRGLGDMARRPLRAAVLSYRRHGDEAWTPLPHAVVGDSLRAAWPAALPEALYDLRVEAADEAGNGLDYALAPALRHGARSARDNAGAAPLLLAPDDEATYRAGGRVDFAWAPQPDPDGDAVRFRLRIVGPGLDTLVFAGAGTAATVGLPTRLRDGGAYRWWVESADGFAPAASTPRRLHVRGTTTDVDPDDVVPAALALAQNYPNPFTGGTQIDYALPTAGAVRIEVFDLLGRRVATLQDGVQPAGRHRVYLDGAALASGVYLCRLQADGRQVTLRMVKRS